MHLRIAITLVTAVQVAAPRAWADRHRVGKKPAVAVAPGAEPELDADAADPPQTIGIEELIAAAVQRSPDLIRIRSDRRIAREVAKAAAAPDEWKLGASVDWKQNTASRIKGQPVQQIGEESLTSQLGVNKTLPTGGAFSVAFSHTRLYQRYAVAQVNQTTGAPLGDSLAEAIGHVASARISVVQPLLRGRGATVSRAARHRAELEAEQAQIKARYDAAVLVSNLVADYWELAYAAEVIDVRRDSMESAKQQLEVAREVYKAGVLPISSLKAAEYAVKVREEALTRATMDLEERSLDARQLAGLEVGPHDIALEPTDQLALDDTDWRVDDVLATARENNLRLEGARLGIKLADISVAVGDDGVTPAVDFRASASAVGGGDDVGEAFQGASSAESYEVGVGVAINYEIGGAASAFKSAAREGKAQALTNVEIVERDVVVAVVRAVHRVRAARKRADVAAAAIDVALANLKAEQVAFKVGRSTSYVVLDRQTEVDEARLLRARAIADYHEAVTLVQLESGELLQRWGVELRDNKR